MRFLLKNILLLIFTCLNSADTWSWSWQRLYLTLATKIQADLPLELLSEASCKWTLSSGGCKCQMRNSHKFCCCVGNSSEAIPSDLGSELSKLTFFNVTLRKIGRNDLAPYPNLKEIYIYSAVHLSTIDSDTFANLSNLRKLKISNCQSLTELNGTLRISTNLRTLIFRNNHLRNLPQFENLNAQNPTLDEVDFSNNQIEIVKSGQFNNLSAKLLRLENNRIKVVENHAFRGCKFTKILLNNNPLMQLSPDAFTDIIDLQHLDVSNTKISELPVKGLNNIRNLRLVGTPRLKHLPSVFAFNSISKVEFTYSHHCCFFQLANREYRKDDGWKLEYLWNHMEIQMRICDEFKGKSLGIALLRCKQSAVTNFYQNVTCTPQLDALNPCEDIVSYTPLRVVLWVMCVTAILGNTAVLMIISASWHWQRRMRLHYIFMLNLSAADFLTGVYLIILAVADFQTANEYYNYAVEWQTGWGCSLAGFISVFASQLSTYSMLLIAVEVYYNSRNAIFGRQISFRTTIILMHLGHFYAFLMALLPLLGVSSYQDSSICLPLSIKNPVDRAFILFVLSMTGLEFIAMIVVYVLINCMVLNSGTPSREEDNQILRRTLILVGTNVLCWVPTLFFGITAALGIPLITLTHAKVCLIVFFPINSCANPLLYVFITRIWKDARKKAVPIIRRHITKLPQLCNREEVERKNACRLLIGQFYYSAMPVCQLVANIILIDENSATQEPLLEPKIKQTERHQRKGSASKFYIPIPTEYVPCMEDGLKDFQKFATDAEISVESALLEEDSWDSIDFPVRKKISVAPEMSDISESCSASASENEQLNPNGGGRVLQRIRIKRTNSRCERSKGADNNYEQDNPRRLSAKYLRSSKRASNASTIGADSGRGDSLTSNALFNERPSVVSIELSTEALQKESKDSIEPCKNDRKLICAGIIESHSNH